MTVIGLVFTSMMLYRYCGGTTKWWLRKSQQRSGKSQALERARARARERDFIMEHCLSILHSRGSKRWHVKEKERERD